MIVGSPSTVPVSRTGLLSGAVSAPATVSELQSPYPPADTNIHVMDAGLSQRLFTPDIVLIKGIAAVNDCVSPAEKRLQTLYHVVNRISCG